jgi:hypothetical protein
MKANVLMAVAAAALTSVPMDLQACGNRTDPSEKNRGNYLCTGCSILDLDMGGEMMSFLKSGVNPTLVRSWAPNDTVTITNGASYATLGYLANGNFVVINTGSGYGSGKTINYEKNSSGQVSCQAAAPAAPSGGGSPSYYAGSGSGSTTNYGTNPGYYQSVCYGCNYGSGSVTMEEWG